MIDTYGDRLAIPENVPFKETLCILAAKRLDVPVKTPTDVLRIAVYLSGGDISLPGVPKLAAKPAKPNVLQWFLDQFKAAQKEAREKFKFRKFSRSERRFILTLLEKTSVDVTEMQRHLGRWLRLGEILHVGEYADRFPKSADAFQTLRNQRKGTKVRTFAARIDLAFKDDWHKGVDLLASPTSKKTDSTAATRETFVTGRDRAPSTPTWTWRVALRAACGTQSSRRSTTTRGRCTR